MGLIEIRDVISFINVSLSLLLARVRFLFILDYTSCLNNPQISQTGFIKQIRQHFYLLSLLRGCAANVTVIDAQNGIYKQGSNSGLFSCVRFSLRFP